ncbi:hypothetical protein H696_01194 [Fonticula alba]|uniref:Uncharacterized protein n=1 Tax=Fonticula alba TaxID=691883 RepID=A0A058ZCW1_FONAL|nr:hypothetical protein H696_01194 [Fonticula alba]KCV71776.1 hypothetical protein H696_01194 [Fonticula alba]|eukprot:XP_009493354.1 hypothetical protein H696_01194 [Fonticula alba]
MYNVSRIVIPYSVFFLLMPGTTIWTARALTASSRDTARSMRALLEAPAALVEEHPSKEAEAGPAHGSPLQMDLGAGLAAEDPAVDTAAVDASAAISALEAASDMGSVLASTTATSVTSSPIAEWIAARGGIEALFRAPNAHLRRLESRLQEWNVSSAAGASAARDQSK